MALRIVYWLRHPKTEQDFSYPASPMPEVRRALLQLEQFGLNIWSDIPGAGGCPLVVDRTGNIIVQTPDLITSHGLGQLDVLDLLGPFEAGLTRGPDLIRPKPHLRIVPGKVAGEPHLEHSRLTTLTVAALSARGYHATAIAAFYPEEQPEAIAEAIELEHMLAA